jgi:hypothetical protein
MIYSFFFLPELGQHLSGLIWAVMLVSAAIVITLPRESGIRTFVASTILRMIFSVGPEPTLILLGIITVSHITVFNPLTPELNPSAQRCLMRFFTGDFAS